MKETSDFGKFLKEIRVSQKLSVRALSENAGVSHSYLSQVENGNRGVPSPEVIRKIAVALDYDYFSLMRAAGYMTVDTNKDYLREDFISTMIKSLTLEQKREFLVRFREAKTDSVHSIEDDKFNRIKNDLVLFNIKKLDNLLVLGVEEKEIEAYLIINFGIHAKPKDYLTLLRYYRKLSFQDIAQKLNFNGGELYKENEENFDLGSPFWYEWSKELGIIFEVDNLKGWLLNQFGLTGIKKPVQGNSNQKSDYINILFNYPRVDQLNGEDIELSEEEAKERFLYLENLLTMDENIYLNSKVLSKAEKVKALQLLKLVFEETENNSEE